MLLITADQLLRRGLELGGLNAHRQQHVKRKTNLARFNAIYGSNPVVYSKILQDLQTTTIAKAYVDPKDINVDYYLMAINFLKCYQREEVRAGNFGFTERTVREWTWFYAKKIQALKVQKIVWPEHWNEGHPDLHVQQRQRLLWCCQPSLNRDRARYSKRK